MRRSVLSRPAPLAGVIVLAVALDQLVKWLVETHLPFHRPVDVLPMLSLFRTYNSGIAFSFLSGAGIGVLLVLTFCVIAFVLYLWRRTESRRWLSHLGYALIVGGAIGNLIDRALLGHVVDYVLVHTENYAFAVFNLADSFITVGACAVLIDELLGMRRDRRAQAEDPHD
ncbi:signal peptidase II [Pararhizobium mangrovi]|uniref:signal peptidase II n=1 Tax=Pararhizobium mangrovi TaxID=2590452 RepID=UPI0015E86AF6|nr:signal peptidase II [Pararhizobium mangrovi]